MKNPSYLILGESRERNFDGSRPACNVSYKFYIEEFVSDEGYSDAWNRFMEMTGQEVREITEPPLKNFVEKVHTILDIGTVAVSGHELGSYELEGRREACNRICFTPSNEQYNNWEEHRPLATSLILDFVRERLPKYEGAEVYLL